VQFTAMSEPEQKWMLLTCSVILPKQWWLVKNILGGAVSYLAFQ